MRKKLLIAALFTLPVMDLLLHLGDFPFLIGSAYTDLAVSHYPNGLFIQQALLHWKTIPIWSPLILSGYPFAANPLSGLFYLPGWLALLFPLPLGFNLLLALHLVWGGAAMFLLLRKEGLSEVAALLGGLAFEAMPKLFSHIGAGHLTLVYAVAWTPWLLYAERGAATSRVMRWFLPGVVLGIIAAADIRWVPYAGSLWILDSACRWLAERKAAGTRAGGPAAAFWIWLGARGANLMVAVMIAAPLLLPLMEYTRLSTRSQMSPQDNLTLSMSPGQFFGLVYPPIGGTAEWMLYPGAAVLALTLYAAAAPAARRKASFWLAGILATLLLAMGSYLPFMGVIARLPGMDLLRVPPRALFLTGFCFAVTAAIGLQTLLENWNVEINPVRDRSALVLFGAAAFVVLFAGLAAFTVHATLPRIQFAWGGLAFLAAVAALLAGRAKKLPPGLLATLLLIFCLVDEIGAGNVSLVFRPAGQVLSTGSAAAAYIKGIAGDSPFRVYSPSYSIPQQTAASFGLQLADGVDPLQLETYAKFMAGATGVPAQGYSVTMPPFASGHPEVDNRSAHPDAGNLGLLNVKYVVAAYPLEEPGLRFLTQIDQTYVYENLRWLPRAWVQAAAAPAGTEIQSQPAVKTGPNWITVEAQGPGLLVLSEVMYPGWQVAVDGQSAAILPVDGLLRGVGLGDGVHTIQFTYHPGSLAVGLGLATVTWLMILALWARRKWNG